MASNEELKEEMSKDAEVAHAVNPQDMVAAATEPEKDVPTAMREARKDYDEKSADLEKSTHHLSDEELAKASGMDLDTYLAKQDELKDKLQTPVPNSWNHDEEEFKFNDQTTGNVGNWSITTAKQYHQRVNAADENNPAREIYQEQLEETLQSSDYTQTSQTHDITPENSKIHVKIVNTDEIDDEELEELQQKPNVSIVKTGEEANLDTKQRNNLASFVPNTSEILMATYTDEEKANNTGETFSSRFVNDDPYTKIEAINHEHVHKDHWINDGQGQLQLTPANAAKADRLTETIAEAASWLQYAQMYQDAKKQGIQTVEINGEQKPLSYILEGKPGLKEAVEGLNGDFDINNPTHKRAIVKASSQYWHKERKSTYDKQAHDTATRTPDVFTVQSYDKQRDILKNEEKTYDEVSERMLKDVPVLFGHIRVDLTDCRDLLDTMSTEEAKELTADIPHITREEMEEIDAHLTAKGLTTETEKMEYMKNFLANSYVRSGECEDPELRNIMLKHNPNITYADGIQVKQEKDGLADVDGIKMNASDIPPPEASNKTATASNENQNTAPEQTAEKTEPNNTQTTTAENTNKKADNKTLPQAVLNQKYYSR